MLWPTAGGHNILVKLMQNVTSPAQQHLVFLFPGSAESNLLLSPCFSVGKEGGTCPVLPSATWEVLCNRDQSQKQSALGFSFWFCFFFNQCRNSFLSPGLSPSGHRGSLNAMCVQPPVSSVILHAGGGSLPFTNISPAALPPEHHLSIEIGI